MPRTTTDSGEPAPARVVLACTSCQATWEPDLIEVVSGNTGCPHCGGWTWIAELAEPERSR